MNADVLILRALVVIDRELRREFPSDFHKRCAYSACALAEILRSKGIEASVRVGDVLGFVVSADGNQAGQQGYQGGIIDGDDAELSHVWVEAEGRTLDLNFHYFSIGGRYKAAPMPAVAWPQGESFPVYAQYRVRSDATHFSFSNPNHAERLENFIARCQARIGALIGNPKPPFWILRGQASFANALKSGDLWAESALRFQRMPGAQRLLS